MIEQKAIILGSTGMLGQQVVRTFSSSKVPFVAYARDGEHAEEFNFSGQSSDELAAHLEVNPGDYVINCIGWIPQAATGDFEVDFETARLLNISLPASLEGLAVSRGVKVLQIATDCVFTGLAGNYSELSRMDASDTYGWSKIQGELKQPSAMRVRASIVGPDEKSPAGLFSWFSNQSGQASVTGYSNQVWNGVTTLALSKLFLGIFRQDSFQAGCFHWVPADRVTKYELLLLFRKFLNEKTPLVKRGEAKLYHDRTLATSNCGFNRTLWHWAGYKEIPTIESLVCEFIEPILETESRTTNGV